MSVGDEELRAAVEALADNFEAEGRRTSRRVAPGHALAMLTAARRIRVLLARPAPAVRTYRRCADDGFDVAGKGLVTHADYTAMTAALEFGNDRTEPAATPAELLPYLKAAFAAQTEHYECERAAEAESCRTGEQSCGWPDCDHTKPAPVTEEGENVAQRTLDTVSAPTSDEVV